MRQPDTRMIGSVGYFPEKYGNEIVKLALDISSTVALCLPPCLPNIILLHRKTWTIFIRTTRSGRCRAPNRGL